MREFAKQIGENHTNVSYWERSGQLPRADLLIPMSRILGVSVETILGQPKTHNATKPAGKVRLLFDAVSQLPRRQQEKVLAVLAPFVAQYTGNQTAKAS